jgi:putative SOS response-associated peptidase YedK
VHQAFSIGEFPVDWPDDLVQPRPMQSGFEYSDWPIIIWSSNRHQPEMVRGHWEFLAPWLKTMDAVTAGREKYTTLNAVGEQMLDSKLYRDAALHRRCLIPSSGFYEWRHWKPAGAKKDLAIPYFVAVRDKTIIWMAGIWQPWTDQHTGEHIISFAIVTTAANHLMAQVHNKKKRMPLILSDDQARRWLDPTLQEKDIQAMARIQFPEQQMQAYPIIKDFRTAPDPIEPAVYPGLPELILS